MKIFFTIVKFTLYILSIVVFSVILSQNSGQYVNIKILSRMYSQVDLLNVILITLTIGTVLGGVFIAFMVIQSRAEVKKLKSKNRQLLKELESLRNMSIDDIPDDETHELPAPAIQNDDQQTTGITNA